MVYVKIVDASCTSSQRIHFKATCNLDYEQSLFSLSVEQNAQDTQMTTRVTEGARRERLDAGARARVHSPH